MSHLSVIIFIFMFSMGMMSFMFNWNHILSTLISLEFMALSLFLMLTISSPLMHNELYTSLFYLALAVCEGALGISILVLFTREKGSDMLSSKNLLTW